MRHVIAATSALLFVACIVAANWLTARYGLVSVAGLAVAAGTLAAGLTFLVRDLVHDAAGRLVVLGLIVLGAALSGLLAGPQLAVASGVAFLMSETADMLVYTPLRRRSWVHAALASNTVGAVVDSLLFLSLAGFPVMEALPGQVLVKVAVTAVPVLLVVGVRHAVHRRAEVAP